MFKGRGSRGPMGTSWNFVAVTDVERAGLCLGSPPTAPSGTRTAASPRGLHLHLHLLHLAATSAAVTTARRRSSSAMVRREPFFAAAATTDVFLVLLEHGTQFLLFRQKKHRFTNVH